MRLLGRDFSAAAVLQHVQARLEARGLTESPGAALDDEAVESPVDPHLFTLEALAEHADSTRGLPVETHRGGIAGRVVVVAKQMFRESCQVLINETLGRQAVFNGHVRDGYAQLAARLQRLESKLEGLGPRVAMAAGGEVEAAPTPAKAKARAKPRAPAPAKKRTAPKKK